MPLSTTKSPLVAGSYKWAFGFNPGNDLVSHAVAHAVPSAQRGLTSVFGMGTGVTLSVRSPETCDYQGGDRLKSVPQAVDNSILMGKSSAGDSINAVPFQ